MWGDLAHCSRRGPSWQERTWLRPRWAPPHGGPAQTRAAQGSEESRLSRGRCWDCPWWSAEKRGRRVLRRPGRKLALHRTGPGGPRLLPEPQFPLCSAQADVAHVAVTSGSTMVGALEEQDLKGSKRRRRAQSWSCEGRGRWVHGDQDPAWRAHCWRPVSEQDSARPSAEALGIRKKQKLETQSQWTGQQ